MKYLATSLIMLIFLTILEGQGQFTEVSQQAGINHAFVVDQATFGGGACVIDFDNDGFEDLYITGGVARDALYKNNGDGTFTNVIENRGFERAFTANTQGVTAADVNRDGFKDILVTTMNNLDATRTIAPNMLFINNKDGSFTEATDLWGLERYRSNTTGATFGDINMDGYPDLYVSNYFSSSPVGISIYNESTITNSFVPGVDFLFLNTGGNGFVEVAEAYRMDHNGFGFQGVFSDYDNDGDLDLHIANDFGFKSTPNRMYRNDFPKNRFRERSLNLALNYGMNAMGIACADVNLDGWMDYFVTNLSTSALVYNKQNGDGFEDMTIQAGVGIATISDSLYSGIPISWGANFFDFDHDQDEDLFVCNGALNPTIRLNPNLFFRNDAGKFSQVAQDYGLFDMRIGRGSVVFDYDLDGDLDLFVVNQAPRQPTDLNGTLPEARCLLLRNDAADGNWLQVELEGMKADKNGLGSRVELVIDELVLVREIEGGASHLSQNTTIAHFGLGDAETISSLTIKWLGGETQTINNLDVNQRIKIIQPVSSNETTSEIKFQVLPNGFIDDVFLEFELEESSMMSIDLYNSSGQFVQSILPEKSRKVGVHRTNIVDSLAPGMYYFKLTTESQSVIRKAIKL